MLSAGLPLASQAHGANTQSAPPPHLSVSVSESHSVILLLFPPPQFLTLSPFIHLPCLAISPYIRAITTCFTASFSELSHSLIPYSSILNSFVPFLLSFTSVLIRALAFVSVAMFL